MKTRKLKKDRKKATENELKKEWVNILLKKKHSKNCKNLVKTTWVRLSLFLNF